MKIGRNDKCHCGSGRKYKKCCLWKDEAKNRAPKVLSLQEHQELLSKKMAVDREQALRRAKLQRLGIYIDFVNPIIFKDKKVWAVGSRVYHSRPRNETFHEFLIFLLTDFFGSDWGKEQASLPTTDQHFVYKAYQSFLNWREKNAVQENAVRNLFAALPDGYSRSLLSLAFDLASIYHQDHLPEKLVSRLKNKDQYQGARYELAIAAIFTRLGCKIEFLDEKYEHEKHAPPHSEMNITLPTTKETVTVEVKSKQREGILHASGAVKTNELYWGNIQRLYRDALKSNPRDKAFLIFIDMNSPQSPQQQGLDKPWMKDVKAMIKKSPLYDEAHPDPLTGLILTNYSYHYQQENTAESGEHIMIIPQHPVFSIKDVLFFNVLRDALNQYGNVPNLDLVFEE